MPSSEKLQHLNKKESNNPISSKIAKLDDVGHTLSFSGIQNSSFEANLRVIDSKLPEILAQMLLYRYRTGCPHLKEMSKKFDVENPLNFPGSEERNFYSYKIKKLLVDSALGMRPSEPWHGRYDATGGYIIVKEDGDAVCYHIYNMNEFSDYLLNNTKFETPSTDRYKFGDYYKENEAVYLKLNLQIRFVK